MADDTTKQVELTQLDLGSSESRDAIARIASAFASRQSAKVDEVVELVEELGRVFSGAGRVNFGQGGGLAIADLSVVSNSRPEPALPVSDAVHDDKVFCLVCGKPFTMLKRHLRAEHQLSEDEYREMFDLDKDFPLVAPNYSARRAEHARNLGLGKHSRSAMRK